MLSKNINKCLLEGLFLQIQGSARLTGSTDTGSTHVDLGAFFNYFVKNLEKIAAEYFTECSKPERVNSLLKTVSNSQLIKNFEEVVRLTNAVRTNNPQEKNITSYIGKLSSGQAFPILGGWLGHGIVYEFKRERDNLLFTVYNTGEGVSFHKAHWSPSLPKKPHHHAAGKIKYYPLIYTVEGYYSQLNQRKADLQRFIGSLLAPIMSGLESEKNNNQKAKDLYLWIFPQIEIIGGKRTDNILPEDRATISPQSTGNCGLKSIRAYLRCNLGGEAEYKWFAFLLKWWTAKECHRNIKNEHKHRLWAIYPQTISNLARYAVLNKLEGLNHKHLYRKIQKINTPKEESHPYRRNYTSLIDKFKISPIENIELLESSKPVETDFPRYKKDLHVDLIECKEQKGQGPNTLLENLNRVFSSITQANEPPYSTIRRIEEFLQKLPLCGEGNYYVSLDSIEKIDKFIQEISELLSLYMDCVKREEGGLVNPARFITLLSVIAVIICLGKEKQIEDQPKKLMPFFFYKPLQRFVEEFFSKHTKLYPYLGSGDASYDERLIEIEELLKNGTYFGCSSYNSDLTSSQNRDLALSYSKLVEQYGDDNFLSKCEKAANRASDSKSHCKQYMLAFADKDYKRCIGLFELLKEYNSKNQSIPPEMGVVLKQHQHIEILIHSIMSTLKGSKDALTGKKELPQINRYTIELCFSDMYKVCLQTIPITHKPNNSQTAPVVCSKAVDILKLEVNMNLRQTKLNGFRNAPSSEVPLITDILAEKNPLRHKSYDYNRGCKTHENNIQTESIKGGFFSKKTLFERQVKTTRSSPMGQIHKTLELFTQYPTLLSNEDYALFFEINLFDSGLFLRNLESAGGVPLLKKLNEFFKDRIIATQQPSNVPPTLVRMIRLQFLTNYYVLTMSPHQAKELVVEAKDILTKLRATLKDSLTRHPDESTTATLHLYRYLVTGTLILNNINYRVMIKDFITDLIGSAKNPWLNKHDNPALTFIKKEIFSYIRDHYISDKGFSTNFNTALCETLIEEKCFTAEESLKKPICFPQFEFIFDKLTILVDMQSGQILKNGVANGKLPEALLYSSKFVELFGHSTPWGTISNNQNQYHIRVKHGNYRILKGNYQNRDDCYVIQKNFPIDMNMPEVNAEEAKANIGEEPAQLGENWCQLTNSDEVTNLSKICPPLLEYGCNLWHNRSGYIITDAHHQPAYFMSAWDNYLLHPIQGNTIDFTEAIQPDNIEDFNQVVNFEKSRFISCKVGENGDKVILHRYGIHFDVKKDLVMKNRLELIDSQSKKHLVLSQEKAPLPAGLLLVEIGNPQKTYCYVPIQKFRPRNVFTHIGVVVRKRRLFYPVYPEFRLDTDHDVKMRCIEKTRIQDWKYKNQERYIVYPMTPGGSISQPDLLEDAIYLVYLYLGQNKPEEACEILNQVNPQVTEVTKELLQYIRWVMEELPEKEFREEFGFETVETPEILVTKLKTLFILSNYCKFDKHLPTFSDKEIGSSPSDRCHLEEQRLLNKFSQSLLDTIYNTYTKYLKVCNNSSHPKVCLSKEEECVLIVYLKLHKCTNHTVDVQFHKLYKDLLGNELVSLIADSDATASPSHQGITSDGLYKLYEYTTNKISGALFWERCFKGNCGNYYNKNQAFSYLGIGLSDNAFIHCFRSFVEVITGIDCENKEQLNCYITCMLNIGANLACQGRINENTSIIPGLCLILQGLSKSSVKIGVLPYIKYIGGYHHPGKDFEEWFKEFKKKILDKETFAQELKNIQLPPPPGSRDESFNRTITMIKGESNEENKENDEEKANSGDEHKKRLKSKMANLSINEYIEKLHNTLNMKEMAIKYEELNAIEQNILSNNLVNWSQEQQVVHYGKLLEDQINNLKGINNEISSSDNSAVDYEEKDNNCNEERVNGEHASLFRAKSKLERKREIATGHIRYLIEGEKIKLRSNFKPIKKYNNQARSLLKKVQCSLKGTEQKIENCFNFDKTTTQFISHQLYAIAGKQPLKISLEYLLDQWQADDLNQIKASYSLSEDDVQFIINHINTWLIYKNQEQHLQRIQKLYGKLNNGKQMSEVKRQDLIHQLFQTFMSKNLCRPNDMDLLYFQYKKDIVLWPAQITLLKLALDNADDKNKVIQLLMGGGKTTILSPRIAKGITEKGKLAIICVPLALLDVNYTDLATTIYKTTGRCTHILKFNRQSNYDFNNILCNLLIAKEGKQVIVTAVTVLQSLFLKYIDMIKVGAEINSPNFKALQSILKLLKDSSTLLVDEVHEAFSIKQELAYGLGNFKEQEEGLIDQYVDFYDALTMDNINSSEKLMAWLFPAEQAHNNANKPISPLLKAIEMDLDEGGECKNAAAEASSRLRLFLNNQESDADAWIKKLGYLDAQLLAIVKLHKDYLLNRLGNRAVNENFGLSQPAKNDQQQYNEAIEALEIAEKKGEENTIHERNVTALLGEIDLRNHIAVPYQYSKPKPSTEFSMLYESFTYSIITYLDQGISLAAFAAVVASIQGAVSKEVLRRGIVGYLLETKIAREFEAKAGVNLFCINPNDLVSLRKYHNKIKNRKEFILYCLKVSILPTIKVRPETLSLNGHDFVGLSHEVLGITGTTSNYRTFHESMRPTSFGFGDYGKIIACLIAKKTKVSKIGTEGAQVKFWSQLEVENIKELKAIIDAGALFKNEPAQSTVRQIQRFCIKHHKSIEWVLYFDTVKCGDQFVNLLHAASVKEPSKIHSFNTTDESTLAKKLGPQLEKRFVFYSQPQCTGTDIKLANNAVAAVTVDLQRTNESFFLQAVMRVRQLIKGDQRVHCFVMQNEQIINFDIQYLVDQLYTIEISLLEQQQTSAASLRINSMIKVFAISQLLAAEDYEKNILFDKLAIFIVQNNDTKLAEKFNHIIKEVRIEEWLKELFNGKKAQLQIINRERFKTLQKQIGELTNQFEVILGKAQTDAIPIVSKNTVQGSSEVEKEKEMEQEQEQDQEIEIDKSFLQSPANLSSHFDFLDDTNFTVFYRERANRFKDFSTNSSFFSDQLFFTKNLTEVLEDGRVSMLDYVSKPIYGVLMRINRNNKLQVLALSNFNYDRVFHRLAFTLREKVSHHICKYTWLETSLGELACGSRPNDIELYPEYLAIQEQVLFFNGRFGLLEQRENVVWLFTDGINKLRFAEEHILPYRMEPISKVIRERFGIEIILLEIFNIYFDLTKTKRKNVISKIIKGRKTYAKQSIIRSFCILMDAINTARDNSCKNLDSEFKDLEDFFVEKEIMKSTSEKIISDLKNAIANTKLYYKLYIQHKDPTELQIQVSKCMPFSNANSEDKQDSKEENLQDKNNEYKSGHKKNIMPKSEEERLNHFKIHLNKIIDNIYLKINESKNLDEKSWSKAMQSCREAYKLSLLVPELSEARPLIEEYYNPILDFFLQHGNHVINSFAGDDNESKLEGDLARQIYLSISTILNTLDFNGFNTQELQLAIGKQIALPKQNSFLLRYLTSIKEALTQIELLPISQDPFLLVNYLNEILDSEYKFIRKYEKELYALGFARPIGERFLRKKYSHLAYVKAEITKLANSLEDGGEEKQPIADNGLSNVIAKIEEYMKNYRKQPQMFLDIDQNVMRGLQQIIETCNSLLEAESIIDLKSEHEQKLDWLGFARLIGAKFLELQQFKKIQFKRIINNMLYIGLEKIEDITNTFYYLTDKQSQDYKNLHKIISNLYGKKDYEQDVYLQENKQYIIETFYRQESKFIADALVNYSTELQTRYENRKCEILSCKFLGSQYRYTENHKSILSYLPDVGVEQKLVDIRNTLELRIQRVVDGFKFEENNKVNEAINGLLKEDDKEEFLNKLKQFYFTNIMLERVKDFSQPFEPLAEEGILKIFIKLGECNDVAKYWHNQHGSQFLPSAYKDNRVAPHLNKLLKTLWKEHRRKHFLNTVIHIGLLSALGSTILNFYQIIPWAAALLPYILFLVPVVGLLVGIILSYSLFTLFLPSTWLSTSEIPQLSQGISVHQVSDWLKCHPKTIQMPLLGAVVSVLLLSLGILSNILWIGAITFGVMLIGFVIDCFARKYEHSSTMESPQRCDPVEVELPNYLETEMQENVGFVMNSESEIEYSGNANRSTNLST